MRAQRKAVMSKTSTPPTPTATSHYYAYGDSLPEVLTDLTRQVREFYGTLDGIVWPGKVEIYNVNGDSHEWQKRAGGKAKYTQCSVTGPAAFPLGSERPAGDRTFLFTENDLRYALDVVHGGSYGEDGATGSGGSATFWYPKFEAAIRRRRAMRLVRPEATDRPV